MGEALRKSADIDTDGQSASAMRADVGCLVKQSIPGDSAVVVAGNTQAFLGRKQMGRLADCFVWNGLALQEALQPTRSNKARGSRRGAYEIGRLLLR